VELTRLKTNLITAGLTRFICSFSGLKILLLMPCLLASHTLRSLSPFLHTVAIEHSSSLRVLSIQPQGVGQTEYLLDQRVLMGLTASCTQLQEIAFGILGHELVRAITVLLPSPLASKINPKSVNIIYSSLIIFRKQDNMVRVFQLSLLRALHVRVIHAGIQEGHLARLREIVTDSLVKRVARQLQYVAFDEESMYNIVQNGSHHR
jgi:hypothetical protein